MPPKQRKAVQEMVLVPKHQSHGKQEDVLQKIMETLQNMGASYQIGKPHMLVKHLEHIKDMFEKIKQSNLEDVIKTKLMQYLDHLRLRYEHRLQSENSQGPHSGSAGKANPPSSLPPSQPSSSSSEQETDVLQTSEDEESASGMASDETLDSMVSPGGSSMTPSPKFSPQVQDSLDRLQKRRHEITQVLKDKIKRLSPQGKYASPTTFPSLTDAKPLASRRSPEGRHAETPKTAKTPKPKRAHKKPDKYSPSRYETLTFKKRRKKK